jgi:5-methylcytosine-specific restriction enzyme B
MAESVRNGLLARTCLEMLSKAETPMQPADAIKRVGEIVGDFSPYEREGLDRGQQRWTNSLRWHTGTLATVGWMAKTGGWHITDLGREALERYSDGDELLGAAQRIYREIFRERKRAAVQLAPFEQTISIALGDVLAGQWTSYDDIAEIADTDARAVA